MKKSTSILLAMGLLGLTATGLRAQVAINNSATNPDASAILDLNTGNAGVNKGFLAPQVALTNVAVAAPVAAPATGLIVYSTAAPTGGYGKGYYYWNGTAWSGIANSNSIISGSGINNYVARWTPNATTLGTGLIQDNDTTVSINNPPVAGLEFLVNADSVIASIYAINNNASRSSSFGIYGEDDNYIGIVGIATRKVTAGVYGSSDSGYGVYGTSAYGTGVFASGDSTGVWARGDTAITAYGSWNGINVYAANDDGVYSKAAFGGVYGFGTTAYGLYGESTNGVGAYAYGKSYGVYAVSTSSFDAGVYGENDSSYGVEGYSSRYYGGYFYGGSGANGYVGDGIDNIGGMFTDAAGDFGRIGDGLDGAAGVFSNTTGTYMFICQGGTGYVTNGTKSTEVKDENNQERMLFCNESPEVMFEDYGEGQLVNGKAHISLDPLFAKNVAISEKHPLRVYIELLGDCNGTYITNRSASGFDVNELKNGKSNTPFQWHIICNRANENGVDRNYADKRFPVGPGAPQQAKMAVHKQTGMSSPALPRHPAISASATNSGKEKARHSTSPLHVNPAAVHPQTTVKN